MAAPADKRAKLNNMMVSMPYVSQSAMAGVLKYAKTNELPAVHSRAQIRDAKNAFCNSETPYGKLVTEVANDADTSISVQNPAAVMWHLCKNSRAFSHLVQKSCATTPTSLLRPHTLMLYIDEVTPGNALAYKNARRTWAVYWALAEWGPCALAHEDVARK